MRIQYLFKLLLLGATVFEAVNAKKSKPKLRATAAEANQKNVLFVIGDDLGAGMPPYIPKDHPLYNTDLTPSWQYILDTFTFYNARTSFTSCGPNRASLFTGRAPEATKIFTFQRLISQISNNIVTLLGYFTQQGYVTETVGKVFHMEPALAYTQWEYDTGQTNQPHTSTSVDLSNCGNKFYCSIKQDPGDVVSIVAAEAFLTARIADPNHTPFFLAVGLHRPHTQISIPAAFYKLLQNYLPAGFIPTIPNTEDWLHSLAHRSGNDIGNMQAMFGSQWERIIHGHIKTVDDLFTPQYVTTVMAMIKAYIAGTRYTITNMAALVSLVEKYGFKNNTVVVLTADHGYEIGGPGNMLGKNSLLEAAIKILLAIRDAGQTEGFVNKGLASSLDLFKTLVHMVFGLKAAETFQDDLGPLQGNSLYPCQFDENCNANPLGVVTQYPRCQPRGTIQTWDCMTNVNASDTCSLPPILWMGFTIETLTDRMTRWWEFNYNTTNCTKPWWPNMPVATQIAAKHWPVWTQIDPSRTGTDWSSAPQEPELYFMANHSITGINRAANPNATDTATLTLLTSRLVRARGMQLTS